MSIFGSIMGAIFGKGSAQASASPTAAPSAPPAQTVDFCIPFLLSGSIGQMETDGRHPLIGLRGPPTSDGSTDYSVKAIAWVYSYDAAAAVETGDLGLPA
jgi:hypothetical protein